MFTDKHCEKLVFHEDMIFYMDMKTLVKYKYNLKRMCVYFEYMVRDVYE